MSGADIQKEEQSLSVDPTTGRGSGLEIEAAILAWSLVRQHLLGTSLQEKNWSPQNEGD